MDDQESPSRTSLTLNGIHESGRRHVSSRAPPVVIRERTVKRLRLSTALTLSENTSLHDACHLMAARRVDALLLTNSNSLLCGILTDKDIATRVIACEVNLENTPVSKVMTRGPVFVLSDSLAVEALQKMVHGKFRHLPVLEKGVVIGLLDIAKCLYDAIARLDRAAEKGKAIAAAVEGVEKYWGASVSGPNTFLETLKEQMSRPSLSSIIPESSKLVTVLPTDSVLSATKKMLEHGISSAVIIVDNKPKGILTSKDILMRVIGLNLSPDSTPVEKVMTPDPVCATVDTPIVDALHTMHDRKFLHLPVVDKDGIIVSVVDVIHVTHAAVVTVGSSISNEAASTMMQKLWDTALTTRSFDDDEETRSEGASIKFNPDETESRSSVYPSPSMPNTFNFKVKDKRGRMHRFSCDTRSLTDLLTNIIHRLDIDPTHPPHIQYEDEDHDKIVLGSDGDLSMAVDLAKQAGLKGLKLHLDYDGGHRTNSGAWAAAYSSVAAGAALIAGLGVFSYLKRSSS